MSSNRPETSYAAQGFTIFPADEAPLSPPFDALRPGQLVALRADRREAVLCWASVADRQTSVGLA